MIIPDSFSMFVYVGYATWVCNFIIVVLFIIIHFYYFYFLLLQFFLTFCYMPIIAITHIVIYHLFSPAIYTLKVKL